MRAIIAATLLLALAACGDDQSIAPPAPTNEQAAADHCGNDPGIVPAGTPCP